MKNRIKNISILTILTLFLLVIKIVPVTCIFNQVTGIYCPACGMTRAFHSILHLNFIDAFCYNILSIPLFIFIIFSYIILSYEVLLGKFEYVPKLLKLLSNKVILIIIFISLFISFIINNMKLSFFLHIT